MLKFNFCQWNKNISLTYLVTKIKSENLNSVRKMKLQRLISMDICCIPVTKVTAVIQVGHYNYTPKSNIHGKTVYTFEVSRTYCLQLPCQSQTWIPSPITIFNIYDVGIKDARNINIILTSLFELWYGILNNK